MQVKGQAAQCFALVFRSFLGPRLSAPHAQHLRPGLYGLWFIVWLIAPELSPSALLVALPCSFWAIKLTVSSSVLSVLVSPSKSESISGSAMPLIRLSLIISSLKSKKWLHPGSLHLRLLTKRFLTSEVGKESSNAHAW